MLEIPPLPDSIRTGLPVEVQAYIAALEAVIKTLQVELEAAQKQMAELEARLGETSQNSSRPPSSDPPHLPPRPRRQASERKRGAQPGHPRHERALLDAEAVNDVIEHRPDECPKCHTRLAVDLPDIQAPARQQVWDIPVVKPHVTEHRYHRVGCPTCHEMVSAERPAEVPAGAFGAGVVALVGLLRGRYRLSVRETADLLLDVFHLPVSPGGVIDLCQVLSSALAAPYLQSQAALNAASHANVDETGWKEAGKRCWLWVAVSVASTVFMIATRSSKALNALLGETYQGLVTSDRFKAYLTLAVERRQICWAHLKRNWQAFSERDGPVGQWGQEAVGLISQWFHHWHQFQRGELDRMALQTHMHPIQIKLRQLLERGQTLPLNQAQAFCRDVLVLWPALWTFLVVEGVAPTNNAAERALRPAVLWRKGCFGSQGKDGKIFVARILTVATTCRQHHRPVLTFLTDAARAHLAGQPAPSLVGNS